MAEKKKATTSSTENPLDDRLRTLEGKALTLETWLKVTLGIATFLGLSGAYLFHRAQDLTAAYQALTRQQTELESRVRTLDNELPTKATAALQRAAPDVLRAEIAPIQTKIEAVNNRVGHIRLDPGPEMNHVFTCLEESRPFDRYPANTVVIMIGQRPCTPTIRGATYFKILSLSIPPAN